MTAPADEAAAPTEPFDVRAVGDVVADPDHQHEQKTEHEGPGQEVVRVLGELRPGREGVRADERHEEALAEDVVQPRDGEHDEGHRRHPVGEALEGVEAQDLAARFLAVLEADAAAREIEGRESDEHADDEDAAEPGQSAFPEALVFAPLRLLEDRRLPVRDRDPAGKLVELPEELILG